MKRSNAFQERKLPGIHASTWCTALLAIITAESDTGTLKVLTSANFELVLFWIRFPTVLRRWHSQLGRMQCVEKLNAILKKKSFLNFYRRMPSVQKQ